MCCKNINKKKYNYIGLKNNNYYFVKKNIYFVAGV